MTEDQNVETTGEGVAESTPKPETNLLAGEERPVFDTLKRIALFLKGEILAQPEHFDAFGITYSEKLPYGISIMSGAHVLLFDEAGYLKEVSTEVIADGSHAGLEATIASTEEGLPVNEQ